MTKKELFNLLRDVPDDAWIHINVKHNDKWLSGKADGTWEERQGGWDQQYVGQIVYEDYGRDIDGKILPGGVALHPRGHELYKEWPLPILPESHPDYDEERYSEDRILYDSSVPLTPPLES